jgi:hypothetical protein
MAYIYEITNDINGKSYVGKTEGSIESRFALHCKEALYGRCSNRPLYKAMKKYGIEHFHVSLLEETDSPEEREIYWIAKRNTFHNGYNATIGGDGKRYIDYNEVITLYDVSHNQKLVASQLNICECTVRKILHQNKIHRIKSPTQCKSVTQTDGDGTPIRVFNSCGDAARFLIGQGYTSAKIGTVTNKIAECANNRRKTAYGFGWKFT